MSNVTAGASSIFAVSNPSPRAARLDRLGARGRLRTYRSGGFDRADLATWVARYPEEVPTVNDEFEWIVVTLE